MLEEGDSSRCGKTQLRKIVASLLENPGPGELEQDGEEAKLLEFLRARSCFACLYPKGYRSAWREGSRGMPPLCSVRHLCQ